MNKSHKLFGASLLALAISGCAVTSQPIDRSASEARARTDLATMFKGQEPLSGPLTLHQAMARAVKYNLEARLKVMEEALAKRQVDLAQFDMLPRMALDAGYVGRNNVGASSSQSIRTGTQSLEPSTSQDRDREVADLTMVWNVLDFGVSYVSAKQQADQRLILQERKRKVIHTITQDVRSAYWRAVAAQRLLSQIDALMGRIQQARDNSQRMATQRIGDPVQTLSYQRALIEATRQLEEQRRALSLAKTELAALINLPLNTDFTLAPEQGYAVPQFTGDLAQARRAGPGQPPGTARAGLPGAHQRRRNPQGHAAYAAGAGVFRWRALRQQLVPDQPELGRLRRESDLEPVQRAFGPHSHQGCRSR